MPEEECEDETNSEAHEPSDEKESGAFEILELLDEHDPFRDLPSCLSENFGLKTKQGVSHLHVLSF